MRPGTTCSPCSGWLAGSRPARPTMLGRALTLLAGKWWTMKTAAARSAGNSAISRTRGSTPPAENPMTMMSRPDAVGLADPEPLMVDLLNASGADCPGDDPAPALGNL